VWNFKVRYGREGYRPIHNSVLREEWLTNGPIIRHQRWQMHESWRDSESRSLCTAVMKMFWSSSCLSSVRVLSCHVWTGESSALSAGLMWSGYITKGHFFPTLKWCYSLPREAFSQLKIRLNAFAAGALPRKPLTTLDWRAFPDSQSAGDSDQPHSSSTPSVSRFPASLTPRLSRHTHCQVK